MFLLTSLAAAIGADGTTSTSTRFAAPPGGANGGGISVSLLPFLPVDQNITLSLQSSALTGGTWSTPPQSALYPVWSKTGTSLQGFRAEGAPFVNGNVTVSRATAHQPPLRGRV